MIPGTGKDKTLLKPGAEKLCTYLPAPDLGRTFRQAGKPRRRAVFLLLDALPPDRNGEIMAEGDGACSSRESKYRYRKAERVCPNCGLAAIIRGKDEYERDPKYKGGHLLRKVGRLRGQVCPDTRPSKDRKPAGWQTPIAIG